MADYQITQTGAELQTILDDFYQQIVPNKIKTSQFVVEGSTGNPLPENGSTENYAIGEEMAWGWVALTAITNATKDASGNVAADSGIVQYKIEKDENDTITELFGSVMNWDGATYTQTYATGANGLAVGSDATHWWLDVDFSLIGGVVFGLSEQLGLLEVDSIVDVVQSLEQDVMSAASWESPTRSSGITYTNTSLYPMKLSIVVSGMIAGGSIASLDLDGDKIAQYGPAAINRCTLYVEIEPLSEYVLTIIDAGSVERWKELQGV